MPFQAVESTRLYRQIADQIGSLIARGEFQPGDRLPAERELASLLGVSRTTVREAIICLELEGRVDVRVGTGIFVAVPAVPALTSPAAASSREPAEPGPFDLLAARRVIEGEIVALAARSIGRAEIDALRETIATMRRHPDDFARRDAADREFHVRIAEATGNSAFAAVVDRLWESRRGEMWMRIESHFHTDELHARTVDDHEAIVDALQARDPDGARAALHRHLDRVVREFRRQWDAGAARPPARVARRAAPARVPR